MGAFGKLWQERESIREMPPNLGLFIFQIWGYLFSKFGVIYFPNLGLFVMVGQIPGRQGPILQTTCQLFIANPSIYHADSFSCLSIARSPSCFPFPMPFPSAFNACLDSRDIDLYICKQISARARGGSRLT